MKLADIKPNPDNPRTATKEDIEKLKNSIEDLPKMMKARPIVIKDGVIVGGNQRYNALMALGKTEIPDDWVFDAKDWTEKEVERFIVQDNVSSGAWDWDILANQYELEDLDAWGVELPEYLTEDSKEVEEDEAPEVSSEPPVSQLGVVYQLGRHRVMCGDSTNYVDVDKLMGGIKSELLFTSPPYSDMREYNGGKDLSVNNLKQFIVNFEPFCEYQAINLGIQRKDNNINTYWDEYIEVAKNCGNKFLAWNVWVKPGAGSVGNQSAFFPIIHEWIFVFGHSFKDINRTEAKKTKEHRQNRKVRQADGSMKSSSRGVMLDKKELESVIFVNPELGEIRQEHPATFSVDLPSKYIKAITNNGDIIADPFLGSGTTLIACEQTDRTCYGCELDPKYVDVIRRRYWKFVNGGDETGWEEGTPAL